MHRNKSFFKKTRKGKILRVVADHYLRDDIGCGSLAGKPVSTVRTVVYFILLYSGLLVKTPDDVR